MAKIVVAGDAVVVTSELKLEDIKTVQKYRPDALILKGGEDGKEEIFRIAAVSGPGDIGVFGAAFGQATRDEERKAVITMMLGQPVGDVKEYIADKWGAALMNLGKLEESIPAALAEIAAQKEAVIANITVA